MSIRFNVNYSLGAVTPLVKSATATFLPGKINELKNQGYAKHERAADINQLLDYIASNNLQNIESPLFSDQDHLNSTLEALVYYVRNGRERDSIMVDSLLNNIGKQVGQSAQSAVEKALILRQDEYPNPILPVVERLVKSLLFEKMYKLSYPN